MVFKELQIRAQYSILKASLVNKAFQRNKASLPSKAPASKRAT